MLLKFSYVGMKPAEANLDGSKPAKIIMFSSMMDLGEVVVTGYQNIKREDATSSYALGISHSLHNLWIALKKAIIGAIILPQANGVCMAKTTTMEFPGSYIYAGKNTLRVNAYGMRSEQMYYVAGESLVRTGKIDEGLDKIDFVRSKRIHPDFFKPNKGNVSTEAEAVNLIRKAKRVEFVGNYETFFECKRLNSEPQYAEDIVHDCGSYGKFIVKPDSPLWIYPFPMTAVNYNSSLTQNY